VTSHGLAINVDLDLGVYGLFDACGLGNARFTSIAAETGRPVTTDDVREPLLRALAEAFDLELDPLPEASHAVV
jgi:lipoate-protein ligase B